MKNKKVVKLISDIAKQNKKLTGVELHNYITKLLKG
tara:strand:+ start:289 stop:396 length:108 start_codon:yes stop_codon:yes gene_type:complete